MFLFLDNGAELHDSQFKKTHLCKTLSSFLEPDQYRILRPASTPVFGDLMK